MSHVSDNDLPGATRYVRTDDTTIWMFRIRQTAHDAVSVICAEAQIDPDDPDPDDLDVTIRAHYMEASIIDAIARANALILDAPPDVRAALDDDLFAPEDFDSPSLGL